MIRHARDIDDGDFLLAVEAIDRRRARGAGGLATVEDLHLALGAPVKVVRAKARRLIRRGLLEGCACGCRGDFRPRGLPADLA